jgi:hypothetical protein
MAFRRRAAPDPDPSRASLYVEDVGVFDVRVRHAHAGVADLDMDPALVGGLDGRDARLVAPGGGGIDGRLALGWAPGHVRFTRDGVQRRHFTRVEVDLPALLVPERLDGMWRASLRDISAGGGLVADADTLPLGARLEVQLELDDPDAEDGPLWTPGRVIRAPGSSLRVVRFEGADVRTKARIQRWVLLELIRRREA